MTPPLIDRNTNLNALIAAYPECREFLWPFRADLSQCKTLERVAHQARCPVEVLVRGLTRGVERAVKNPFDAVQMRSQLVRPGCVNVAGFVDFSWRTPFMERLHEFADAQGFTLNLNLFKKHQKKAFQNYLACCENPAALPELLIGKGFSSLMTQQFVDRFVHTGVFSRALDVSYGAAFHLAGLRDPQQAYHPFAADEYVMVFDPTVDPACRPPQSWADLQRPAYAGKITQMGKEGRDHFGFAQLFFLMQADGEAGLARYARNVRQKQHFAGIVKNLARSGTCSVNVMHQYATQFIRHDARNEVEIITPSDGNPVTARYFLLKQNASAAAVSLAKYLYSDPVADLLAGTGLLPAGTDVKRPIRWVGWDAVKSAGLPFLKESLSHIAYQYHAAS